MKAWQYLAGGGGGGAPSGAGPGAGFPEGRGAGGGVAGGGGGVAPWEFQRRWGETAGSTRPRVGGRALLNGWARRDCGSRL